MSIQRITNHAAVPDNGQSLSDAVQSSWNKAEIIFTDGFLCHVERTVIRRHAVNISTAQASTTDVR